MELELDAECEKIKTKQQEIEYKLAKRNNEILKDKQKLEKMKAKMEHQHKIAELIAQMKQTKMQNGKEFKLAYLGPLSAIIQQNKALEVYLFRMLIFIYSRYLAILTIERQDNEISEANKFQINQNTINTITEDDRKFQISDMLKIAINQNIMTENDRKYLLDEEKK
ncbi:hypothetical protein C2G38_2199247 [Gigaspora rosea]|uniref:Uncharacterized protein n=1 Tax=Gigaspora rosea TaxID=44941 RepID=A0A397URY5_9GLOM|nr:hypothetical protein C2G38_2199247 [Gigaspora rosea]